MTMLIAGHETTAAMLTWTLFELTWTPGMLKEIQAEVRTVLKGKDRPDYDDVVAMKKLRYSLIEALRLYPEPPLLIRRARTEDDSTSRQSDLADGVKVLRGTDMFISTWNFHRSPDLWENPETFDPTRYERPFKNPSVVGWAGYDPTRSRVCIRTSRRRILRFCRLVVANAMRWRPVCHDVFMICVRSCFTGLSVGHCVEQLRLHVCY